MAAHLTERLLGSSDTDALHLTWLTLFSAALASVICSELSIEVGFLPAAIIAASASRQVSNMRIGRVKGQGRVEQAHSDSVLAQC